jgi:four helix bundle protein
VEKDLEERTKRFGLTVIKFTSALPRGREVDVVVRQLLRAATSIGANYREANRGVSRADFANKIGTVQKEAAEAQYWLELMIDSGIAGNPIARDLHREASELLAIFTSIGRKLKDWMFSTLAFLLTTFFPCAV